MDFIIKPLEIGDELTKLGATNNENCPCTHNYVQGCGCPQK